MPTSRALLRKTKGGRITSGPNMRRAYVRLGMGYNPELEMLDNIIPHFLCAANTIVLVIMLCSPGYTWRGYLVTLIVMTLFGRFILSR